MGDRDRDARGRARNARPRDAAGRPLARNTAGAEPTRNTAGAESTRNRADVDPTRNTAGVESPGDPDRARTPHEALDEAQRLLDADLPFTAHEVLETAWKASDEVERPFWQGLAQLAVGLTHAQRGNAVGAASLLERGAERIAGFGPERPYGVDVAGLVEHATALAAGIRAAGRPDLTEADRRPRLRGGSGGGG